MNLSPILDGKRMTMEVDAVIEPSELDARAEVQYGSPLCIKGMIKQNAGGILLSAQIQAEFVLACDRCLKEVRYAQDIETTVRLSASDEQSWEDELDLHPITDGSIDLVEIATSALMQELPMQILCEEGCLGLCPTCGEDLNTQECTCEPEEPTDHRFDVLKELLK